MIVQVEGKDVEISNEAAMAGLKETPEYNAELDRMRLKGEAGVRDTLTGEHSTSLEALRSTHAQELASVKTLSTGKVSDQMQVLINANAELTQSFTQLKGDLAAEKENGIKAGLQSQLAASLASVGDDLVRNTLIENGMKNAIIGEDGQPYFKLKDGIIGDSKAMASQFAAEYPNHFLSNQPSGAGIKGGTGNVPVPNKPYKDMNTAEKAAYLETKRK